jgi:GNAT superfamily N-acetyltransferase
MTASTARYEIRAARPDEILRLRSIEDEAGTRFTGLDLVDEDRDVSFPLDRLARLIDVGQVWVAADVDDLPVGMVIASVRDHAAYVEEMDVLPRHGRRGLGTRLLARVVQWATERGHAAVTLCTFRDVPWNGPFYRRQGFRDLEPHEWSPGMAGIRAAEAEHGLRVEARVFMRRDLPRRNPHLQVRIARQTTQPAHVLAFYRDGLGLPLIDGFRQHDGYDGFMLALPGTGAHLEFITTHHVAPPSEAHIEDLLVLALGDPAEVERILARLDATPVRSANPYWDKVGVTVVDPDGFRVVLVADRWQ